MDAAQRTGIVTFAVGHVATAGAAVTARLYFDVPVRFDTDHLSALAAGAVPKIPLEEIRARFCGLAAANDGCISGARRS